MKFLLVLLTLVVVIVSLKSIEGYTDANTRYSDAMRRNDNDVSNNSGYEPPPRDKVHYFPNDYDTWAVGSWNPFSSSTDKDTTTGSTSSNTSPNTSPNTSLNTTPTNSGSKATSIANKDVNTNKDSNTESIPVSSATIAFASIVFVLGIIAVFLALKLREQY